MRPADRTAMLDVVWGDGVSKGGVAGRSALPLIGEARYVVIPSIAVELAPVVRLWEATGGRVSALRVDRLPICSTSMWTRPAVPDPADVPLRLHFDVKAALGFDHAVISRYRIAVVRRSRVGDRIGHHQVLRSVGPEHPTALGWGRTWEIDHVLTDAGGQVLQTETFTAVGYQPARGSSGSVRRSRVPTVSLPSETTRSSTDMGGGGVVGLTIGSISRAAAACRVWAAVHHDPVAARRAGLPGVIACTQHLAAVLEQAGLPEQAGLSEHAGLDLRMRSPVFAARFS